MARPNKYNLQYFPLDVDFFDDHKVISIEETSNIKGGYIALRLMAMVYADKGYYLEWPKQFEFTAAKRIGNNVTGALVAEIFKLCLKTELFNNDIFSKHGIVTSHGIQKRWFKIMNDCRRKIIIRNAIWLVSSEEMGVSSEVIRVSAEETTVSATFSTQKEKKVNEKKEELISMPVVPATENKTLDSSSEEKTERRRNTAPRDQLIKPTHDDVKKYFMNHTKWPEDVCHNEALGYMGHYTANGWVQKKGKPIVSWEGACTTWMVNKSKGTFEPASTPAKNQTPSAQPRQQEKQLPKLKQDINYLFEKYLENPDSITVISVDQMHYDLLKNNSLLVIDDDTIKEDIRQRAVKHLKHVHQDVTDKSTLYIMKKLAVLDFFKNRTDKFPIFTD